MDRSPSVPSPSAPIAPLSSPLSDSFTLRIVERPGLLLWAASIAMLSVPVVTLIDVPIARWFDRQPFPTDFSDALELTRGYAHGSGVFFILLSVFLLAPDKRWLIPRIAIMTCGGGAVATILKMFVLRPKPTQINLDFATVETAWLWRFDWTLDQVASFDASTRAFPSGNMATAVALTVGLCMVVPRGRWLFLLFCGLTVLQRLHGGSHFFSDVVGGAAAGFIWSYVCLHPKLLGSIFDKMEPQNEAPRRSQLKTQSALTTLDLANASAPHGAALQLPTIQGPVLNQAPLNQAAPAKPSDDANQSPIRRAA